MIVEFFRTFVEWLAGHAYLSAFIAGLVYEEVLAITAAITGNGAIPLWVLYAFGFLGIMTADIFWFYFIRIKPLFFLAKKFGKWRKKAVAKSPIGSFPPPTELKSYIFVKMFYGIRSWGIFYCSVHGMPFSKFLVNTAIATIIWLAIFIPLARVIGSGIYLVFDVTKSVGIVIALIAIVLILWLFLAKILLKRVAKTN